MKSKKAGVDFSIEITTAILIGLLATIFIVIFWNVIKTEVIPMIVGIVLLVAALFIIVTKEDFFDSSTAMSIIGLLFIVGLGLVFFPMYKGSLFAWAGINQEFKLETENYNVFITAYDKYWQQTGCKPSGCAGKNACSVQATVIGEELGCPIEQCYGSGYFSCQSSYNDRCQYGAVCEYPDSCTFVNGLWSGTCCADRGECVWETSHDLGTYGGPTFDNFDNCAWMVRFETKDGVVQKKWDAIEQNGAEWPKDGFYREPINYIQSDLSIKYIMDDYGVVQRRADGSAINSCRAVVFQVEDNRYIYDICIGNDGLETVKCADLGYQDVLTKTCKLTCPNNIDWKLDAEACVCRPNEPECNYDSDCNAGFVCKSQLCVSPDAPDPGVPEPEPGCTTNSQCDYGYMCVNNECIPEYPGPEPDPEPEPELNWLQRIWKAITDFFKNLFVNPTWT